MCGKLDSKFLCRRAVSMPRAAEGTAFLVRWLVRLATEICFWLWDLWVGDRKVVDFLRWCELFKSFLFDCRFTCDLDFTSAFLKNHTNSADHFFQNAVGDSLCPFLRKYFRASWIEIPLRSGANFFALNWATSFWRLSIRFNVANCLSQWFYHSITEN